MGIVFEMSDSSGIPTIKEEIIRHCVSAGVLSFGTFTLKSGRVSPYFFNSSMFHRADILRVVSTGFAQILAESKLEFDVLFGPAFKGIPLAVATLEKLANLDQATYGHISYSFDRKVPKDYGEGGVTVGAPLNGRKTLVIDDVLTSGKAIREAIHIIQSQGGKLVGIIVAFDRQETVMSGSSNDSAIGEISKQYNVPVMSILTLADVINFLKSTASESDVERLEEYRKEYGVRQ